MSRPLPSVDELPEWVSEELKESAELAFQGGRYVTNGHAMLAVTGPSWSFESGASFVMKQKEVVSPAGELSVGAVEIDTRYGLTDLQCYSMSLGPVSIALRYYALVRVLYGDVRWFGTGEHDPVVVKRDDFIVAVVMPVRRPPSRPEDSAS